MTFLSPERLALARQERVRADGLAPAVRSCYGDTARTIYLPDDRSARRRGGRAGRVSRPARESGARVRAEAVVWSGTVVEASGSAHRAGFVEATHGLVAPSGRERFNPVALEFRRSSLAAR